MVRKYSGAQDINMFSLQALCLLAFVTVTGLSLGNAENEGFAAANWEELLEYDRTQIENYPQDAKHKVFPRDCSEVRRWGLKHIHTSGLYIIHPKGGTPLVVFCDLSGPKGDWTVIQRNHGSNNFNETWERYVSGFGSPLNDHWIGNFHLHHLTKQWIYILRVTLENSAGAIAVVDYYGFAVDGKTDDYTIRLGYSQGNITGTFNDNVKFATYDHDTASECASQNGGGWWYGNCNTPVLNSRTITWGEFCKGSCRRTVMKVRPVCQKK
ncbi:fibrinogen-like protein 1-like protein [Protopterus annectens]|uniref:fibrinogen-like protein 1-like protein n=1 Tax=Protopterus annectens TaxID=7888 RepID=UPI001CFA84C0|nr:fibrinogen-like protein 1-like protein [Protopterus annectens]